MNLSVSDPLMVIAVLLVPLFYEFVLIQCFHSNPVGV